jgi:hypothetical protein
MKSAGLMVFITNTLKKIFDGDEPTIFFIVWLIVSILESGLLALLITAIATKCFNKDGEKVFKRSFWTLIVVHVVVLILYMIG